MMDRSLSKTDSSVQTSRETQNPGRWSAAMIVTSSMVEERQIALKAIAYPRRATIEAHSTKSRVRVQVQGPVLQSPTSVDEVYVVGERSYETASGVE